MTITHFLRIIGVLGLAAGLAACESAEPEATATNDAEPALEQAAAAPQAEESADETGASMAEESDEQVAAVDPQTESSDTSDEPEWVEFFTSGELLCTESGGTFRLWASRDGSLKTKFSVNSTLTGSWEMKGPNSMGWELGRGNRVVFPYQVVTAKMRDDGTMTWGPTTCEKS